MIWFGLSFKDKIEGTKIMIFNDNNDDDDTVIIIIIIIIIKIIIIIIRFKKAYVEPLLRCSPLMLEM